MNLPLLFFDGAEFSLFCGILKSMVQCTLFLKTMDMGVDSTELRTADFVPGSIATFCFFELSYMPRKYIDRVNVHAIPNS